MADDSTTEWTTALNECVADRLAENGVSGPPVDVLCLAARLGFIVVYDDRMAGRARRVQLRGFAADAATTILIRPEPRSERIQWSVAHEIGEHFVLDVWRRLGVEPDDLPPSERERTANALANRLLLPSPWFDDHGRECDWDLLELKSRFVTASFELIARRMLEVDDVPAIITIVDRQKPTFRRGTDGLRAPPMSTEERRWWSVANATGQFQEHVEAGCRTRVWPIHEPEWKREIMRTEPTECFE